ncbi:MAG: Hpt domain-containing protein, partial [Polaromonas sp.]|nr:Hpt domain-containing protein [Polaromonas sp.]
QLMRGQAPQAANDLKELSLCFSARQADRQPRIFWKIAAAFFEAVAHCLLKSDVYVRRAASRVLLQYASLAKGDTTISERLAQDLLFFCAQAACPPGSVLPALSAVRATYGLAQFKAVDYELVQFGRFDPALLAQARKRITSAKETWSSLAAGDVEKFKLATDQFNLVADSLRKLHPASEPLALALTHAVDTAARSGLAPRIELAMEVATSVLYLEAAFADLDPNDPQLALRTGNLAQRLEDVRAGGDPQPLESWMEELYSRVNDKQTMGSVVGELRVSLDELENALDQFFRNPQDKTALQPVPGQLGQMRGVFSVLGLDQAVHAILRMKDSVEQIIDTEIDEQRARIAGTFDHLGNNLGALSFLIDMLNYQPVLAKKLFIYDEDDGELKPLMGRTQNAVHAAPSVTVNNDLLSREVISVMHGAGLEETAGDIPDRLDALATRAALAEQPALAQTVREAAQAVSANNADAATQALASLAFEAVPTPERQPASADFEEDDLLDIFLEEAREVVGNARQAVTELASDPGDVTQLTILRRAFHTLKGSSRMVGLSQFGEAAWALEQLLNTWLADQKTATDEFRSLCSLSMAGFTNWIDDIAASNDMRWSASPFRSSADSMRVEGRYLALDLSAMDREPGTSPEAAPAAAAKPLEPAEVALTPGVPGDIDIDIDLPIEAAVEPVMSTAEQVTASEIEIDDIDFDSLFGDIELEPEPMVQSAPAPQPSDLLEAVARPQPAEVVPLPEVPAPDHAPDEAMAAEGDEAQSNADEQVRVIGSLRIGIPLYNVYLNEADEWSRRLVTEVAEWAMEHHQPVSDSTVALAHSLAGSSATVGFSALSEIARALEHALQQSRAHHSNGAATYGQLFVAAADEVRRLLHQFAAGFLKESDAGILDRLKQLEFADSILPTPSGYGDFDFSGALPPTDEAVDVPMPASEPRTVAATEADAPGPSVAALAPVPAPIAETVVRLASSAPVAAPADMSATSGAQSSEEFDAVDAIDPDLFPIFEEECAELMPQLGGALRQWSARPDNHGARMEALRALHTLKGSARLAGAMRLGEMAHRIESEIEHLGSGAVASQEFEPLVNRFDAMQAAFERLRRMDAAVTEASAVPPAAAEPPVIPPVAVLASTPDASPTRDAAATSGDSGSRKLVIPPPQAMIMQPLRQAATASIRVRSQLLDRMVNQAGEVMITRSRLEAELGLLRGSLGDMTGNLNRLRQQLRDIELQAETQMQSRLAQAKEAQAGFDPLEFDRFTRVQELTRMMAESVNDVATVQRTLQRTVEATEDDLIAQARQTRELQRDLLRTRMVEFEGISERLYRVVRQASKETGKQVRLDLLGGTVEMDRGMLDRMTPAFEHLLRNCVVHGIESPQERTACGKEPVGLITVHLRQEGNDVSVDFSDDGAGLNLRRIREKALSLGLVRADQPLDDREAAELIFLPSFSTATEVTELAGRGIGMDVVRAEVNALGGRVETSTEAGKGTHFKLVLPLTTAVTHVVMIRAGNQMVGVPANVVEVVRRTPSRDLQQAYNAGTLDVAGEAVPFFWAGALLQVSNQSAEAQARNSPVVIFRSASQRIALHVDEVLGNQEVVVKNLGPQLSRLPGLAGMSVLASGAVVLIYNPVALASVYGEQARRWSADRAEPHVLEGSASSAVNVPAPSSDASQIPLILVVDDSITVRRVTQRLLQREGYRVAMAADGLQALERLQEELPTVVLSDIEMPRMDGFDLARNIRADARLKHLPIIMITSRIAEKHHEHAMELGVDHYLGKPYSEEELMSLVHRYAVAEAAVAV